MRASRKQFVLPYGLEGIVLPIMDYIILKTNKQIDRVEKEKKNSRGV